MTTLQKLFAAFLPVLAVACVSQPATDDSGESGEAVSSSHADAGTDGGKRKTDGGAADGGVSEDGGADEDASLDGGVEEDASAGDDDDLDGGSDEPCVDISTLECDGGAITLDGCLQSNMVGAPTYGRCN